MAEKYVVSILRKNQIDENNYMFNYQQFLVGEIDDDNVFTAQDGRKYPTILKIDFLKSPNQPYGFSNVIKTDDLMNAMGVTTSFADAVRAYEAYFKRIISCIQLKENDIPYLANFDYDFLTSMDDDKSSEEEYKDTLEVLNEGIANDKYSLEMLRELKAIYQEHYESSEALLLAIEIAIDSKLSDQRGEMEEYIAEEDNKRFIKSANRPIDIRGVHEKITKKIIAQDEPALRVITELVRRELSDRKKKEALLLTGPTGVGKTYLMSLIANEINRPFHRIDATQLTVPGYVGRSIEEELWDLYIKCGKDKDKAEHAIIFFDEIDKKGSDNNSDVGGRGVINVLLPFIEGSIYEAQPNVKKPEETVKLSTEKMIVVLGGAFTNVYKNLKEDNSLGFGGVVTSEERYREATVEDFVKYGLMPDEFMGRVTVIRLNDLNKEDLKRVLLESTESEIKEERRLFELEGTKVTFTPEYIEKLANIAAKNKTGARGLNKIINKNVWEAYETIYSNPGMYDEVIIGEETIDDSSSYQLVKKQ